MHVGDTIVLSQSSVEHCKIRVDKVANTKIFFQQCVEEKMCFLNRGPLQELFVFRVHCLVRRGGVDIPQAQPLAREILSKGFRLGMR